MVILKGCLLPADVKPAACELVPAGNQMTLLRLGCVVLAYRIQGDAGPGYRSAGDPESAIAAVDALRNYSRWQRRPADALHAF
jgi:hypothetical protein